MVGFGLDYACAHIIILAEISSVNLLPIQANFVTERDTRTMCWSHGCSSSSTTSTSDSRTSHSATIFIAPLAFLPCQSQGWKSSTSALDYTCACARPVHICAAVFHSHVVYRFSNKDYDIERVRIDRWMVLLRLENEVIEEVR